MITFRERNQSENVEGPVDQSHLKVVQAMLRDPRQVKIQKNIPDGSSSEEEAEVPQHMFVLALNHYKATVMKSLQDLIAEQMPILVEESEKGWEA